MAEKESKTNESVDVDSANEFMSSFLQDFKSSPDYQDPEDTIEVDPDDYVTARVTDSVQAQVASAIPALSVLKPNTITVQELKQFAAEGSVTFTQISGPAAEVLQAIRSDRATSASLATEVPAKVSDIVAEHMPSEEAAPFNGGSPLSAIKNEQRESQAEAIAMGQPGESVAPEKPDEQTRGPGSPMTNAGNMVSDFATGMMTGASGVIGATVKGVSSVANSLAEATASIASRAAKAGYDATQDIASHVSSRRSERVKSQLNDDGEIENPSYDDSANYLSEKLNKSASKDVEAMASEKAEQITKQSGNVIGGQLQSIAKILEIPEDKMADKDFVEKAIESADPATKEQIKELEAGYVNDLKAREEKLLEDLKEDPEFQALSEEDQARYLEAMRKSLDPTKTISEEGKEFLSTLNGKGLMESMMGAIKDMYNKAKEGINSLLGRIGAKQDMEDEAKNRADAGVAPGSN